MESSQNNPGSYLTTARKLASRVAAAADDIDRERELPDALFTELADNGFFRLLVPRSLGGGEIDYLEHLSIVQTFAEVDASTAWCINQNNVFATVSAKMPEPLAREIWDAPRAVVANGPPTNASAVPVSGGYRLTGRWNFSSGCRHATWMSAVAPVKDPNLDTEPSRGKGEDRMLIMPKEQVNLVDVWQVNGLRGTGTFSFEVKDVFVPSERTFNPSDSPREEGPPVCDADVAAVRFGVCMRRTWRRPFRA